jgi:hypothetical protein
MRGVVFIKRNSRCLFLIPVEAVDGGNGAKEAVLFAVDAGGEKQRIRRPGVRVIAKGKGPESIDVDSWLVGASRMPGWSA